MVEIGNVQAKNLFSHVLFRKSLGYFCSLLCLHYNNLISPLKLGFVNWNFIIKASRFGFKLIFKQLFCCLASIFVLVADKQNFHIFTKKICRNLNFAILLIILLPSVSAIKIAAGPQEIILEGSSGKFHVFNPNNEEIKFSIKGSGGLFFNQTKGILLANSKIDIGLKAYEEGDVLVKFLSDDLEPGVQIKVKKPDIPNYGLLILLSILGLGLFLIIIYFSLSYSSI